MSKTSHKTAGPRSAIRARLTQEPEVPGSIPGPATFVSPSADSKRAVVS